MSNYSLVESEVHMDVKVYRSEHLELRYILEGSGRPRDRLFLNEDSEAATKEEGTASHQQSSEDVKSCDYSNWYINGIQQADKMGLSGIAWDVLLLHDAEGLRREDPCNTNVSMGHHRSFYRFCHLVIWGTANAGFGIIVELCMYAIGSAAQKPGRLAGWRGISFFLGSITIVISFICWFLLGTPREISWINPKARRMVQARIVANRTGTDAHKNAKWKKDQIIEAFTDPSTWFLFCTVLLCGLPNGGITSFGNLLYKSFGFTSLQTVLLSIPRDAVSVVWFLVVGFIPAFIGMLVVALLPDDKSYRWFKFGMYLMACSFLSTPSTKANAHANSSLLFPPHAPPLPPPSPSPLPPPTFLLNKQTVTVNINGLFLWLFLPSNVAGRTKKSFVSSILFVAYCTGNVWGCMGWDTTGFDFRGVPALLAVMFILAWRYWLVYLNISRDRAAIARGLTAEQVKKLGAANAEKDMTDKQNSHFRYTY
ncbi:hypothetical protein D9758_008634 [Tetrapyrgos nigripes]|uniref:Uncharacterized protein n=1 Tax=Tetrapyrgos nigripes TaxID=182062 RepID=A0A8H5D4W5_9AGAR|nr:hypothetical protein D9758_008634 [Tetrapyrgos nigripes]